MSNNINICNDCINRYKCNGLMKSKNAYGYKCNNYKKEDTLYISSNSPLMRSSLSKQLMDEVDAELRKSIEELTFKTEPIPVPYSSFNLWPKPKFPAIKNVIFNNPATIVFWEDGTKTIVKCQDGDVFDPEKGLTMAISKKALGNKGNYCNEIKKWTEPYFEEVKMVNEFNDAIKLPGDNIKEDES